MDNSSTKYDHIANAAVWTIFSGIESFSKYNDGTTSAQYAAIVRAYNDIRSVANETAPRVAAEMDPDRRRAEAVALQQRLDLGLATITASLSVMRQRGSASAKKGLPDLKASVDLLGRYVQAVCQGARAGLPS